MRKIKKEITDWDKFRDQFVRWTLRRASFRWPPRGMALKAARVDRGLYKCAICNNIYNNREVRVDHVDPVVPVQPMSKESGDRVDVVGYVLRMFPEVTGFQVLCSNCHDTKTKRENDARRQNRKLSR